MQEAKASFSEVVRRAEKCPQHVTVHGKEAAVVLSAREYERLCPKSRQRLTELMSASPLTGVEFGQHSDVMPVRELEI